MIIDSLENYQLYYFTPETFVMLYPHDAHMAGLMIDVKPEFIKKVVVKIKKELLTQL
ncbi:YhcH/YjgK/YiaL family protein [bacterium]|nr:YhcH/YjgK/YiaL family protein [bacterium]